MNGDINGELMVSPEDLKKFRLSIIDEQKNKSLTQSQFATKIGMNRNTYAALEAGINKVNEGTVKLIEDTFNKEIQRSGSADNKPQQTKDNNLNNDGLSYMASRRQQKYDQPAATAALVPIKLQAGYTRSYDQEVFLDTLEKYALPPGISHIGAVWRYFEVEGSSMEPTFMPGDVLLASQVPREDWEQLRNFYIYIIVTQNNLWVKRVHVENNNIYILISDNDADTAPFTVNIDEISEIWVFRRHIKKTASIVKKFDIDKIRKHLK